ncbi:MAG: hypothetical protein ABR606_00610 [Vicinamibacterales bacterium]
MPGDVEAAIVARLGPNTRLLGRQLKDLALSYFPTLRGKPILAAETAAERRCIRREAKTLRAAAGVLRSGGKRPIPWILSDPSRRLSVSDQLERLAVDLESLLAKNSRPVDIEAKFLVMECALVCRHHGIRFTESKNGPAAFILRLLFAQIRKAHMSHSGLRRYLRAGRRVQEHSHAAADCAEVLRILST